MKQQNELCSVNRDPESLNPWRPDCIYLLEIHSFMFLITCCTIKHYFTDFRSPECTSVYGSDLFREQ
ncbi:hypothetical protein AMECASPLE_025048 [Ameca splendens]|uniref:Uncharacterized protein n=1 Tax=Ameca splendens TaxID=208324 RepID=A0ABV1A134_9TELE